MPAAIQIPQNVDASSPLGALVAHFNSSSKSVQKMFGKLFAEYAAREKEQKLQARMSKQDYFAMLDHSIEQAEKGQTIAMHDDESVKQFLDRLVCTQ